VPPCSTWFSYAGAGGLAAPAAARRSPPDPIEVRFYPRIDRVGSCLDLNFCGSNLKSFGNKYQVRSSGISSRTRPPASISSVGWARLGPRQGKTHATEIRHMTQAVVAWRRAALAPSTAERGEQRGNSSGNFPAAGAVVRVLCRSVCVVIRKILRCSRSESASPFVVFVRCGRCWSSTRVQIIF
jgi:hypothetical protein